MGCPPCRPARADREDLGAGERGETPQFGEAKVVADERADRESAGLDDRQALAASVDAILAGEGERMDLVVGADDLAARRDDRGAIAAKAFRPPLRVAELDVPAPRLRDLARPRDAIEPGDAIEIEAESRVAEFRQQQERPARQLDRVEHGHDRLARAGRVLPLDVVLQARESHGDSGDGSGSGSRSRQRRADRRNGKGDRRDSNPRLPESQSGALTN